ncbi:MAG: bifunctional DNA-formamidopyrimidine glycosylase/DNA-(apurinic or apyrimidinic site) lyase, partial [Phycisphaerae bacterium]
VRRRAKRVIVELSGRVELIFHLGMSGRLTLENTARPVEPHTHVRIVVRAARQRNGRTSRELRFRDPRRFGGVWCLTVGGRRIGRILGPLGVEPLEVKLASFRRLIARRRKIKGLLLDQRIIAGLGNIYCDESLFAAGVHPRRRADGLREEEVKRLLRAIRTTLRGAIRHNGSTLMDYRRADGSKGSFQNHHRVYQREGEACRTCDVPIERTVVSARSTFFCPNCQRE